MTSPTAKHRYRTEHKLIKAGRKRKNLQNANGTTETNLALTKPNANELKQKAKAKKG
jgi:hypothetical protein